VRPVTLKSELSSGDIAEIQAFPTTTPGLVVSQPLTRCGEDECWAVVHARSGVVVGPYCWRSPEGALAAAAEIADFCDWQQRLEDLQRALSGWGGSIDAALQRCAPGRHKLSLARSREGSYVDNGVIA